MSLWLESSWWLKSVHYLKIWFDGNCIFYHLILLIVNKFLSFNSYGNDASYHFSANDHSPWSIWWFSCSRNLSYQREFWYHPIQVSNFWLKNIFPTSFACSTPWWFDMVKACHCSVVAEVMILAQIYNSWWKRHLQSWLIHSLSFPPM